MKFNWGHGSLPFFGTSQHSPLAVFFKYFWSLKLSEGKKISQKLVLQSFRLVDIFEGKVMQKNSVSVCKPLIMSSWRLHFKSRFFVKWNCYFPSQYFEKGKSSPKYVDFFLLNLPIFGRLTFLKNKMFLWKRKIQFWQTWRNFSAQTQKTCFAQSPEIKCKQ